jgi:hypothetical protein
MATRVCEECKKEFTYEPPKGFPDKRKYCDECSAKRKAAWEAKKSGNVAQDKSVGQIASTEGISKVEHDFQSEYEFGPAGNRHKIKYRNIEELKVKMKELEDAGYFVEHQKI